MIDAIRVCIDQMAPAGISLWTWTVAEYEVQTLSALMDSRDVERGLLVIDGGARKKNGAIIGAWQDKFGRTSVRYVLNHAKIATVEGRGLRVLLRGSMNLNYNPRFEQFDLTEGGRDFSLVREIESELPVLDDGCSGTEIWAASKVSMAFDKEQLAPFKGLKRWAK